MSKKSNKFRTIDTDPERIFVFGDIHGTLAETEILLDHLVKKENLTTNDLVVFVGDYIDRGYDSKKVVQALLDLKADFPATTFLCGNHEDMMLDYLGLDGSHGDTFIDNGGLQTLLSYGAKEASSAEEFIEKFPKDHLEFFKNLETMVVVNNFIIVHAGLNPENKIEDQVQDDMFWIRNDFIMNTHEFEKTVVFGHTPFKDIFYHLPYKIGIDTGLVYGNTLTCIELNEKRILQVKSGKKRVKVSSYK